MKGIPDEELKEALAALKREGEKIKEQRLKLRASFLFMLKVLEEYERELGRGVTCEELRRRMVNVAFDESIKEKSVKDPWVALLMGVNGQFPWNMDYAHDAGWVDYDPKTGLYTISEGGKALLESEQSQALLTKYIWR